MEDGPEALQRRAIRSPRAMSLCTSLTVFETNPDLRVDERHEVLPAISKGVFCHTTRSHHERLKTLLVLLFYIRLIACHAHRLTLRPA
ncbi:hypothetical protein [Streptomyces sp. NPDC059656]|uniref:hypothetical protein n=1 Tax=Streptomyces sp. NPDC059656 TaxID=3346898 RepID=UPI00368C7526